VDMLDYLEFITFDSGPGQAMLREKQFYDAVDANEIPLPKSMAQKVQKCMELMEDGDRRLIINRRVKMHALRLDVEAYKKSDGHVVSQKELDLG
jgi:hypothetical protein